MMITLLGEGDHVAWAETYGLTFPVLTDPGWAESNKYEQDHGIPTFHLLGRDLTIRILDGQVSESAIQEALDEPVPEVDWDAPPPLDEPMTEEALDVEGDEGDEAQAEPQFRESPFGGGEYSGPPMGGCRTDLTSGSPSGDGGLLLGFLALLGWVGTRRRST